MEETTYMEGGDSDDSGSNTVKISLVSATKPGTFRLLFNEEGKVTEGSIVLYGEFKRVTSGFGETYTSTQEQAVFLFQSD